MGLVVHTACQIQTPDDKQQYVIPFASSSNLRPECFPQPPLPLVSVSPNDILRPSQIHIMPSRSPSPSRDARLRSRSRSRSYDSRSRTRSRSPSRRRSPSADSPRSPPRRNGRHLDSRSRSRTRSLTREPSRLRSLSRGRSRSRSESPLRSTKVRRLPFARARVGDMLTRSRSWWSV